MILLYSLFYIMSILGGFKKELLFSNPFLLYFIPLFFLRKDGISKSFDELDVSVLVGIELIFLFQALSTIFSTPISAKDGSFSNPVAITVIVISSSKVSSITAPKIILASGSTLR